MQKLNLTSYTLLISGIMYLGFGLIFIISPTFLEHAYIFSTHPTGLMEIRAFYGGLEIGLGFTLLYVLKKNIELQRAALFLLCSILFFTLISRVIGALIDGIEGSYLWIAMAIEAPIFIAALIALRKLNKEFL